MGGGPKASLEKRWVRLCWEGGEVIGTMSSYHRAGDRKGGAEVCLFHTLSSHKFCQDPPGVYGQVSPMDWKSTVKYPERWHT